MVSKIKVAASLSFFSGLLLILISSSLGFPNNFISGIFGIGGVGLLLDGCVLIAWDYSKIIASQREEEKVRLEMEQVALNKKRHSLEESILERLGQIQKIASDVKNSGTYLINPKMKKALSEIERLQGEIYPLINSKLLKSNFVDQVKQHLRQSKNEVLNYNTNFVAQRKVEYKPLWKRDNISLDDEQQTAIVTDDRYNLVVAGAGSGKTEVLNTRIHYLIARKPDGVSPNKILAIAYQNKDVKQINQRLTKLNIIGVTVRTFHGLGLDILHRAGKFRKILGKVERRDEIKSICENELKKNPEFYDKFLTYIKCLHEDPEQEDFGGKAGSLRINRALPYTSISNEQVKSLAEKEIFDFMLTNKLNGRPILVKYEHEIENVGKPDFYLPDYDLYIEHWGLTKEGEVPKWFDQTTEEYKTNKQKKKQWFTENKKILVETCTHEYDERNPKMFLNMLSKRITDKLQERDQKEFRFETMTYGEIINAVHKSGNDWISEDKISEDIGNFIKNVKTYNLSSERIIKKLEEGNWSRKQRSFSQLALWVFEKYQKKLAELDKLDFEDMINDAIVELNQNTKLCSNMYDQILVDEYQDVTQQTNRLIKAIMMNNPDCKLFCVGDDWQSIMGFAGSNLTLFVNFGKFYEDPAISKIATNYRSVRKIVEAGTCLMQNNKKCQISKTLVSKSVDERPIKILWSPHQSRYRMKYYEQIAEDCANRVSEYLEKGYMNKDILILSRLMRIHSDQLPRYHFVIENLFENLKTRDIKFTNDAKDERRVRVLSVHKAKGLEAKVVFLLNAIKDTYGFPCEIEDTSLFEPAKENYPLQDREEEERRLFYVALTRAKEDLSIYTWEPAVSEFIDEISKYAVEERLNY